MLVIEAAADDGTGDGNASVREDCSSSGQKRVNVDNHLLLSGGLRVSRGSNGIDQHISWEPLVCSRKIGIPFKNKI